MPSRVGSYRAKHPRRVAAEPRAAPRRSGAGGVGVRRGGSGAQGEHVRRQPQPRSSRGESRSSAEGASPQKCIWSRSPPAGIFSGFPLFSKCSPHHSADDPHFLPSAFQLLCRFHSVAKKTQGIPRYTFAISPHPYPPTSAFLCPFLKSCCKIPVTHVRGLPTEKHAH